MLRIAVCDDSRTDVEMLEAAFDELPDYPVEYDVYFSGKELLMCSMQDKENYHLYIFDIEMPDMNGLELAKEVRKRDAKALFVFLTSYTRYVMEVFEVTVELPAGKRFSNCDPDNACRCGITCNMTGFCPEPQDLMCKRKQLLSLVRQCNRMTDPFKQRNPQFVFELLDLKGNGGLGKSQPLCSLCKAFQFVDHDKCFQIFNIH